MLHVEEDIFGAGFLQDVSDAGGDELADIVPEPEPRAIQDGTNSGPHDAFPPGLQISLTLAITSSGSSTLSQSSLRSFGFAFSMA